MLQEDFNEFQDISKEFLEVSKEFHGFYKVFQYLLTEQNTEMLLHLKTSNFYQMMSFTDFDAVASKKKFSPNQITWMIFSV